MAGVKSDQAAAFKDKHKPGPKSSRVQIRDAGADATRDDKTNWDDTDESSDESFPASDSGAKY